MFRPQGLKRVVRGGEGSAERSRCNLTMTIPITSADSGYPLHIDVGTVPGEPGGDFVRGSE